MGQWKNDVQHGKGEEIYTDGSRYIGYFENGFKKGKGKTFYSDGSCCEGYFSNNLFYLHKIDHFLFFEKMLP